MILFTFWFSIRTGRTTKHSVANENDNQADNNSGIFHFVDIIICQPSMSSRTSLTTKIFMNE